MCSFCFYFPDVFSSTMWSDLRTAVPQGSSALQSLASSLPDVALASRTPSTSSKYFSSYIRWRSWAREHGFTVFPAGPLLPQMLVYQIDFSIIMAVGQVNRQDVQDSLSSRLSVSKAFGI